MAVADDGTKSLKSLSDLACHTAQSMGVTELSVTDHDLQQQTQDCACLLLFSVSCCISQLSLQDGSVLPFRYTVAAKSKVNVFEPKRLGEGASDVRPTMLGAVFVNRLSKLPRTTACSIIWEAAKQNSTHAL